MACGLPVAAYPVTGPVDVVMNGVTGMLDEDLRLAALGGAAPRPLCVPRARAEAILWEACTRQFLSALAPRVPASRASRRSCRSADRQLAPSFARNTGTAVSALPDHPKNQGPP